MPTMRKVTAPARPAIELPAELTGWQWSTNPKTGHYFLMHPEHPATFTTRHYPDPDKAIAEARRWVLSQPKEPDRATLDEAITRLRGAGYDVQPQGMHWRVRLDGADPTVLKAYELIGLARPFPAPAAPAPPDTPPADNPAPILIDLAEIVDNPFQPRLAYDEERIATIAASIKEHGLLQAPLGRRVARDRYELAFGHSRLRAFVQLAEQDSARFGRMPLVVRDLDDQAMALHAWIENKDRADLTAYEEAKAIERYTTAFGWTQQAAADKLQLDRSTVANKLRLLKLPAAALDQLRTGNLSERQALALLPLAELPATTGRIWIGRAGFSDVTPDQIMAKAGDFDSATLRQVVDAAMTSATIALKDKPWRNVDADGVRSPQCKECPFRIAASDRCTDKACANIKERAWRGQQAQAAAEQAGLPTTSYDSYGETDDLSGVNLAAIKEVAAEKGCGNLAVQFRHGAYYHHKVEGFKDCGIVCGHGPNKRCGCKQALARRADPTTSREAKERHDRAKIRAELVAPAEAAVAAALATPTLATWRTLLGTIDSRAKLPADADVAAIQAAIAAKLVKDAVQYNLDYNPDYGRCQAQIAKVLHDLGVPKPWADQPSAGDPAEGAAREHLAHAIELAGHPMVPAYLKQARFQAEQVADLAARAALLTEIDQAADVCAQTPADGPADLVAAFEASDAAAAAADASLLALSNRLTPLETWIARAIEAPPALEAIAEARETLEEIGDDLEQLVDAPEIDDEIYEDMLSRIGKATQDLLNLAEAGPAPMLAEVGA